MRWSNGLALGVLSFAFYLHWNATYYLGKYFDRLVVPRAVVIFGPYRWVRHPIYTSYMLLFGGFCVALRSYLSLVFLITACLLYYQQRTAIEERLLVDNFQKTYTEYRDKVRKKFVPFLL
eukprot:SM003418S12812  [mRNA]  locus=s3418:705:1314:- [translate_table: standard]